MLPIHLLSERPDVTTDDLLALSPGPIIACDCYVQGAESWQAVDGGYEHARIVNVDHHANTDAMARIVSSANLALDRVRKVGLPPADAQVVITHTDCDSILSAGIMSGRLAAEDRYGEAALAADHTGDVNAIADLLQALDKRRDVELSFDALSRLEAGHAQTAEVEEKLAERAAKRAAAVACVRDGIVAMQGNLAIGRLTRALDGEFFGPLLPDAVVIVLASPHHEHKDRLEIKLRLGRAAPEGFSLHALSIREFDPAYGGRWNAGSSRRGGGTTLPLDAFVATLQSRVNARLNFLRQASTGTSE
jgi:hypothetical protein